MSLQASDELWNEYKKQWGKKYEDKEDSIR